MIPEVPLATPGQGGAGTYFIAWVADLDVANALPAGQPVPTNNPSIVRGGRTQNFDHLGGGEHRVTAVLVGSDGVPCTPRVSASISFTLQPTVFGEAQHRVSTVLVGAVSGRGTVTIEQDATGLVRVTVDLGDISLSVGGGYDASLFPTSSCGTTPGIQGEAFTIEVGSAGAPRIFTHLTRGVSLVGGAAHTVLDADGTSLGIYVPSGSGPEVACARFLPPPAPPVVGTGVGTSAPTFASPFIAWLGVALMGSGLILALARGRRSRGHHSERSVD